MKTIFKNTLRFTAYIFLLTFSLNLLAQDAAAPAAAPAAAAPAAAAGGGDDALAKAGEAVFNANCKQCHGFNEVVVGPALKDAHTRWNNDVKLKYFIKYPQKSINTEPYAKALYEKYKPSIMPNHDGLPDGDIDAVIAYIKTGGPAPVAAAAATPGAEGTSPAGGGADSATTTYLLGALLVVLLLIVGVLAMLISVLTRMVSTKPDVTTDEKEYLFGKMRWNVLFGSPIFRSVATLVLVVIVVKFGFDQVYAVGIQQGYAPKQPIPFSHKLHAGQYEIDCNYCHTGVNKGKSAVIPSVNICLNCHNAIKTQSPNMQKLYQAVEENEPIQWVRVHNLPDLAYFNHAQHVKVGGIECTKCHGNVAEMEVIEQHSTLTMGWCINCHRETVVKAEGNAYYDKLLAMHNQSSKDPMKVANIGGLECSKCHY
jgi:mono/diheme cytochrome c family protein